MAEGFYRKSTDADVPTAVVSASQSVMRLSTGRRLHYRLFKTVDEADEWSGFKLNEHGIETYRSGWTHEKLETLSLEVPGPDSEGLLRTHCASRRRRYVTVRNRTHRFWHSNTDLRTRLSHHQPTHAHRSTNFL